MIVDFGLGIKDRNLFHLLQVELLTNFRALVELPLRRTACTERSEVFDVSNSDQAIANGVPIPIGRSIVNMKFQIN